ncbi:MAG: flagellar hook-basal body protein [Pelotomaculum sp.]|uniref:Flagellar basal body rod protein n=1 Tax=Pelotomaculum thermopropionicum (strain DSM 13744 / JCM 10971 / SI) TaxID=370438 RepID=A5D0H2_PELTS|nr:flagellar hook-basal body protein [Pelotomaculum sp.]BAF60247.1 flagellar basal body rod protein [Pelotomaculum thermopropionicum SI]
MLKALSSAVTGLNAQRTRVDAIAVDLANIAAAGYKRNRTRFAELVSQEIEKQGIPVAAEGRPARAGSGVRAESADKVLLAGETVKTERPFDLLIEGEGYFRVVLPGGEEVYTRNGCFTYDKEGNLYCSSGYRLEGVSLPEGWDKVIVSPDGRVSAEKDGSVIDAGQITLYRFSSMAALKPAGSFHFYLDEEAGEAIPGTPGSEGFGVIRQGYLETSNVDLTGEITGLIEAQTVYGFNARSVRIVDEMWGMANNLRK